MKKFSLLIIGLKFSDSMTPHMHSMSVFHNKMNNFLLFIMMMVFGGLGFTFFCKSMKLKVLEKISVEIVWTVIPAISLIFIGYPSLSILYQEFPDYNCANNLSVFAHQWYWSYRNSFELEDFDSFMKESSSFRCLEVDNPIVLKMLEPVRFLISSADVIHSFALPKFGLKVDAVPGRMKESFTFPLYLGKFFGQCSEICGANHSFMPISVEMVE